jgi:hypothetical protein
MNNSTVAAGVTALTMLLLTTLALAESKATTIKLTGGQKVPIVTVAELNAAPADHEGLIAIDGQVGELYPDKGRFILFDYAAGHCEDPTCEGCAADQQLPIRYDKAKLTGKLPAKADKVYAVAFVKVTDTGGFTVALREVRRGDKTILTIKK